MEKTEYKNIFDNERTHFYYVGTHNAVITLLNSYLKSKKNNLILDAGCGTGLLMKKINSFGKIYGIDSSNEALKLAKKNNITKTKKASVEKIPFKGNYFDAIVSID